MIHGRDILRFRLLCLSKLFFGAEVPGCFSSLQDFLKDIDSLMEAQNSFPAQGSDDQNL